MIKITITNILCHFPIYHEYLIVDHFNHNHEKNDVIKINVGMRIAKGSESSHWCQSELPTIELAHVMLCLPDPNGGL